MKVGIIVPVYNEKKYVKEVLNEILELKIKNKKVVAVDDGSDEETKEIIRSVDGIEIITHKENKGYGASIISGFKKLLKENFDFIITIDADRQHFPKRIPEFLKYVKYYDIVSGSRYMKDSKIITPPPPDRKYVNFLIQKVIFYLTGIKLTDAFCGFKAYKSEFIKDIKFKEKGYAFPLEVWYYAYKKKAKIKEIPCELFYPETRKFRGEIEDKEKRVLYYKKVLEKLFKKNLDELFLKAKKEMENEYPCY
jgi:dolichol-phosphate mannosyltransferase